MNKNYLFTSSRLGFREWNADDIDPMATINADPDVMEFFPSTKTHQQTKEFIERQQEHMILKGFCYFAVDKLEDKKLIGFIGIAEQTFESSFTPFIDIGWRLGKEYWGAGYATEGAKRCIEFAKEIGLKKLNSTAPKINLRSEHVMKKIGMHKIAEFVHPALIDDERLRDCVLYELVL